MANRTSFVHRSRISATVIYIFVLFLCTLQDIDFDGFRRFLDAFLDCEAPEELSRHLFLSFLKPSVTQSQIQAKIFNQMAAVSSNAACAPVTSHTKGTFPLWYEIALKQQEEIKIKIKANTNTQGKHLMISRNKTKLNSIQLWAKNQCEFHVCRWFSVAYHTHIHIPHPLWCNPSTITHNSPLAFGIHSIHSFCCWFCARFYRRIHTKYK